MLCETEVSEMDTAYEKALKRRDELRKELEEIKVFMRLHAKFSGGTYEERGDTKAADDGERQPLPEKQTRTSGRNPPREQIAEIVRDLMVQRRKPMTRTDILDALELTGHPIVGVNPSKNIGTIMWRLRDRFVNLSGYGYWPSDMDFAPAEYVAGSSEGRDTDIFPDK